MDAQWERDPVCKIQPRGKPIEVGETMRTIEDFLLFINSSQLSEVMCGVTYLHELKLVHGDLKGVSFIYLIPFHLVHKQYRETCWLTVRVAPASRTLV